MLKSKALWFILGLLAVYLLLGYFAGPRFIQPRLEQYVFSQMGRELRLQRLQVDPLTWSVRLDTVELVGGRQSLWPGLSISADTVDLRFNFWRLAPAVSALTLHQPVLVLADTKEQVQTVRYPFVSLWQQWQESVKAGIGQPVPIQNWYIEAGQVFNRKSSSPAAGEVLLDNIFLQVEPQDPGGSRKYSLGFSGSGNVAIESKGLFRPGNLSTTGQYQLQMASAADGSMAELQAAGTFSGDFMADAMRIYLTESQLHSDRATICALEDMLCAVVMPLDVSFASSVLAASDGIRLLQANARLGAFQLDASLGRGALAFVEQQDLASAQIQLVLPLAASPDGTDGQTGRNFVIQLDEIDNDQYQIKGQLDMVSHTVDARFEVNGSQDMSGNAQLRIVGPQPAQAAYSRLDLQLENPAASLAQQFIEDNFTPGLASRTLQLQLAANMDEFGLKLQETIMLEQTRLSEVSRPDFGTESTPGSRNTLDAKWLLALLQDPDDRIELKTPELTIDSTTKTSLRELSQQQAKSILTELSEQPFAGLAKALNVSNQNLHEVRFAAGSAALDGTSTKTLADLTGILLQRPALGIAIAGVYDPLIDKKALQIEQLRTHVGLAMAGDLAFRTGAEPPDFTDPIVHSVIDEFARRRLPPSVMEGFTEQFGHADADQGVLPQGDVTAYYSSLFELLVEYAEIPQGALTTLARYRAQAVMEELEDAGVAHATLEATTEAASSDTQGDGIALPLQLKPWFDGNANPGTESARPLSPLNQPD